MITAANRMRRRPVDAVYLAAVGALVRPLVTRMPGELFYFLELVNKLNLEEIISGFIKIKLFNSSNKIYK